MPVHAEHAFAGGCCRVISRFKVLNSSSPRRLHGSRTCERGSTTRCGWIRTIIWSQTAARTCWARWSRSATAGPTPQVQAADGFVQPTSPACGAAVSGRVLRHLLCCVGGYQQCVWCTHPAPSCVTEQEFPYEGRNESQAFVPQSNRFQHYYYAGEPPMMRCLSEVDMCIRNPFCRVGVAAGRY